VDADVLAALEEGLYLLRDVWPEAHDASQRLLRSVVVLEHSSDLVLSFTDGRWLGVLFASCREAFQVAGSIVHETAHARLAPLLSLGPLLLGDDASTHRSPWRSDPRSLHGLLNGVHAFTNVCTFYRRLMER